MPGSRIGEKFRVTTFGESHGRAIGAVIDGVHPGLQVDLEEIQRELDRRRPGQSRLTTQRRESDRAEILSGVFEGKSTGTPICVIIWNRDQRPEEYRRIKDLFRPGHAGYTYLAKFGISDYRGGGRSSGRETAARVAAGALAKAFLAREGVRITAYTHAVAGIEAKTFSSGEIGRNLLRCPDRIAAKKMERKIRSAMREGDSVGGVVEVVVKNPPVGLGDPVFDKLEADLAKALMSIGAVRGFEVGNGFRAALLRGSQNNDPLYYSRTQRRVRTRTNNAGGIAGGISNGEDIVVRIAVKPTSSIRKRQETVTSLGKKATISVEGRHDPCICPRIVPVAEAMVALTLYDHLMRQRIQHRETSLRGMRHSIDLIDRNILLLLAERQELARAIGHLKRGRRKGIVDTKREQEIMRREISLAGELSLEKQFVQELFRAIFHLARSVQRRSLARGER